MADLSVSGLASGFDWKTLVDQLTDVERAPQRTLLTQQTALQQRNNAYQSIFTQLSVLKSRVDALSDPAVFGGRSTISTDATVLSATAASDTRLGTYDFNVTQLATASSRRGTANVGKALNASNDVSALTLDAAAFTNPVTAGTFTVNNKSITIATTDTLQAVFDKISTATGGTVTASYDSVADRISLSSASEIVVGSAADTSNFLQIAKLNNNGGNTVTSSDSLGAIKLSSALTAANLSTTISDGGAGAGLFKVNGVEIAFKATDSINDVIRRVNGSVAGVTASYDTVTDRFSVASKTTGDVGIALEDVTGNFLAATGLSSGSLTRGQDLLYTVNGGGQLRSHSSTITSDSSGITGLSVTATKIGVATVTVNTDSTKITGALNDFIAEYNRTQALIDTNTASTTDSSGKVTAGVLAAQSDANELASRLRSMVAGQVGGLTGTLKRLEQIGISTNGTDNNLALTDTTKLNDALLNNVASLQDLFTNSTTGIATTLSKYLDSNIGDDGKLVTRQSNLTTQSAAIDTQIADMERNVQIHRQQLVDGFVAMESARQTMNQQLQFLTQRFGTPAAA